MHYFSQEFKDQIIELHRKDGRTYTDLAKEFDLSATTVSNWVRTAEKRDAKKLTAERADTLAGDGGESYQAKIKRLEKEWRTRSRSWRSWESAGLLRTASGPVDIYAYIRAQKAADPEVDTKKMCRVLGVSPVRLLRLVPPP